MLASSTSLRSNAREFRLEGSVLHVSVPVMAGGVTEPGYTRWESASFPLDTIISNTDGVFERGGGYGQSARNVQLNRTVLIGELMDRTGAWRISSIDLDDLLSVGPDGSLFPKDIAPSVASPPRVSGLTVLPSIPPDHIACE